MKVKKIIFGVLVSMFSLFPLKGMADATEVVALKNNLEYDAALTPNLEVEVNSVELEGGVDAGYSWYDQFECKHCGNKTARGGRWFVLPKFGVNLSVPLGGNEESMARRCDCELLYNRPLYEEIAPLDTMIVFEDIAPLEPIVPLFEVQAEAIHRLRSRLFRDEESYEAYDSNQALSADPRNVFMFFEVNAVKMDRDYL